MSSLPAQYQVVRIGTGTEPLSKSQKEFNRLTQKIEQLTTELHELRGVSEHIQQRVQADYHPLIDQYSRLQADLVRLFDRAYGNEETTKAEKKKLAELIRSMASDLISVHGMDSLRVIYDKYTSPEFSNEQELANKGEAYTGTNDDVEEYILQQEAAEAERQRQRANQPKSAKQLEREAKKRADEQKTTKAVRTLYMDLVKAFHPDREPDEAEKLRKTEIMHRVIAAYEKSDLLALFRLQLEFERIDQTHLEALAEDQLTYYNKILRQQAQELETDLLTLQKQLTALTGKSTVTAGSLVGFEFSLNSDIAQLKRDIKQSKQDLKALASVSILKQWLKGYR
ncbi:J domain-containing protein [Spirosoma horti]